MRIAITVLFMGLAAYSCAQDPHASGRPLSKPGVSIPTSTLAFTDPDLASPLQIPSSVMSGGPRCGPGGRAFLQIMTPPPMYNYRIIFSISPDGKGNEYKLDQINGLANPAVVAFDPGLSVVTLLLTATSAGGVRSEPTGYYLAFFDYDGKFRRYSKLDLGLEVSNVAQLDEDSFIVMGVDSTSSKAKFLLVNGRGTIIRDLLDYHLMPSDEDLSSMLNSLNFAGTTGSDIPTAMKNFAVLSLYRPVHSNRGLLLLLPGAKTRVTELLQSGEVRTITLNLPKDNVADSLIVEKNRWFLRSYLHGSDNDWTLFELEPESGNILRRINTSGVPPTSIACPNENGFSALRWIDKKPYLISGNLK